MSQLKKFFEKAKKDVKFKAAGQGHSLRDDDRPSVQPGPSRSHPSATTTTGGATNRPASVDSNQKAAQAALARLEQRMGAMGGASGRNTNLLREVYTEMGYSRVEVETGAGPSQGVELGAGAGAGPGPGAKEASEHPVLSVEGVFYKCPVIGPFVLPRDEMEKKIEEFLKEQHAIDPTITSAVMLATLNADKEKLQIGRETLRKYLENIVRNPGEEKYRRIRVQNKAFQERVLALEAAEKFLLAAGFQKVSFSNEGENEEFFVLPSAEENIGTLTTMLEYLDEAEPILAELDRNVRLFRPSGGVAQFHLPDEFYSRTAEEVQEEYKRRMADLEKNLSLRTKAMRDLEERQQRPLRNQKKYRFTVLRIRIPGPDGGFILQGTFGAFEKLSAVENFVRENLIDENLPFVLTTAVGNKLTNSHARLNELDLVPAAIMNFQSLLPLPPSGNNSHVPFLKQETLDLMQKL